MIDQDGGRRDQRRPSAFAQAALHVWRGVTFWRIFAIFVFLALMGAVSSGPSAPLGPHVARLWVDGMIMDDPDRTEFIDKLAADDAVEAILVRIDSPGGTIAGSEALYDALRRAGDEKPVVAVMGEMAASGGYITAIGADWIVARGGTMTASIGVLMQYPNVEGLLSDLGIEMHAIKSSPIKAEPDPFGTPPEAALALHRAMIADSYAWFRGLVAERRGLEGAALDAVADGRVMTGRQALDAGLVDAIGGEREALDWLADTAGVAAPVKDRRVEDEAPGGLLRRLLSAAGVPAPESLIPPLAQRALIGPRLMAVAD